MKAPDATNPAKLRAASGPRVAALAVLLLLIAAGVIPLLPPGPLPTSAEPTQFSAERAIRHVAET